MRGMMALECQQDFPSIWPSDLHFDPIWPMLEPDLDIIKKNIMIKFQHAQAKIAASRVLTSFSFNLA